MAMRIKTHLDNTLYLTVYCGQICFKQEGACYIYVSYSTTLTREELWNNIYLYSKERGRIVKMVTYKTQEMKGFRRQAITRSVPESTSKLILTAVKTGIIKPGNNISVDDTMTLCYVLWHCAMTLIILQLFYTYHDKHCSGSHIENTPEKFVFY